MESSDATQGRPSLTRLVGSLAPSTPELTSPWCGVASNGDASQMLHLGSHGTLLAPRVVEKFGMD